MLFLLFAKLKLLFILPGVELKANRTNYTRKEKTCFVTLQARVWFVQRCLYYTQCRLSLNEYFLSSATNAVALPCY